jgi:signal transduction histidine kinase
METSAAWSTQQLAEFLAIVSAFDTEDAAALGAVERAAEALDAEVAAIVADSSVMAAVGYREGTAPLDDLKSVAFGPSRHLTVPGVGRCPATAVALDYPPGAALVLARLEGLDREEITVLQGMAQVAAMTMRMLHLLGEERELLNEQAALRRVATLVARGVDQQTILTAFAEEIGRLAGADMVNIFRYEPDGTATRVAMWTTLADGPPLGESIAADGHFVFAQVLKTRAPVRLDDLGVVTGRAADIVREFGMRSAVANPIMVDGQLWGAAGTGSTKDEPLPDGTEQRISGFTELVATAISNANARAELAASRARVVAASDATRRRIERDLHDGIQQRLVTLALGVRGAINSVPSELPQLTKQLGQMAVSLEELIEEVREISRGLHPAILSEAGLAPALKSLARRSPVPVQLDIRLEGRLPPTIELAAYYIVSEALTNTAKHANASEAKVTVEKHDGLLHIEVVDDGVGGAVPRRGSGLVGLTDRVEALGGSVAFSSPPDTGTTMIAKLPTGQV